MEGKTIVVCNNKDCEFNSFGVCQKELVLLEDFNCFAYDKSIDLQMKEGKIKL